MKKFELTTNTRIKFGCTLIQIKAAFSFGTIQKNDLGGWVENENSLGDDVWIYRDAEVFANAVIRGGEIRGGVIRGGEIRGGVIRGGVIRGGEIRGGVIWGGVIWGGEIRGGEIWGGVIRGGVIRGGVIRGGEIRGGVIWGGVIRGGVIENSDEYISFCSIGSDSGVLTAYIVEGKIELTRGCFRGSIDDFEKQLKEKHKNNHHFKEYTIALQLIKARFSRLLKEKKVKK